MMLVASSSKASPSGVGAGLALDSLPGASPKSGRDTEVPVPQDKLPALKCIKSPFFGSSSRNRNSNSRNAAAKACAATSAGGAPTTGSDTTAPASGLKRGRYAG